MGANNNLKQAKAKNDDEFYTRRTDIEKEVFHYKEHFKGKVVYCNCDDPEWSNFFIYFRENFKFFGLKKLISTHYSIDVENDKAYKLECVEYILDEDGLPKATPIYLKGDGDFRSEECIELLKQSDIVCTNPPFSLFREYVVQLVKYEKKFLIIGNTNAITYKEIFPLIKDNKMWLGISPRSMKFNQDIAGVKTKDVNACWYTNLPHRKRNDELIFWKDYNNEEYHKYENYNAIEISKVAMIPKDYTGAMGVPITFIEKYNPNQFEIIGMAEDNGKGFSGGLWDGKNPHCVINGKNMFKRIFIKLKKE